MPVSPRSLLAERVETGRSTEGNDRYRDRVPLPAGQERAELRQEGTLAASPVATSHDMCWVEFRYYWGAGMAGMINVLMLPLMLLNLFGGIGSGIWLAILGEWGGIGIGLLFYIGGVFICGLLILPGLLFSGPGAAMIYKGGIIAGIGFLFGMAGLLWTYVVMSGWAMFSFDYFMSRADSDSYIPYLIWAYGVATGPWTYMANKEDNSYSMFSVFFLQVAAAMSVVMIGFLDVSALTIFLTFSGIMLFGYILSAAMGGVLAIIEARMRDPAP